MREKPGEGNASMRLRCFQTKKEGKCTTISLVVLNEGDFLVHCGKGKKTQNRA